MIFRAVCVGSIFHSSLRAGSIDVREETIDKWHILVVPHRNTFDVFRPTLGSFSIKTIVDGRYLHRRTVLRGARHKTRTEVSSQIFLERAVETF